VGREAAVTEKRALVVAIAGVALLDVGARWVLAPAPPPDLPTLAAFDAAQVRKITLGRVDAPIVLERADDGWRLTAPIEAPADPQEVDAIVGGLAGGVHPEARVAEGGDLAPYGLANGEEVRVDLEGDGPLASLIVGADSGDGGTFLRLPDDHRVFRARIGGHARYDRPPRTLVDHRVHPCDPAAIQRVEVAGGVATRAGDDWAGLDRDAVNQLLASICALRGDPAEPERVAWDLGAVTLDGDVLRLGKAGDLRYVGVGERAWSVPAGWVDKVADPATFADRTLWTLQHVDRIELHGPGVDGELVRDGAGWSLRRPANVDLDPSRAEAVASWLLRPRVSRWGGPTDGFVDRVVVRGDQTRVLELGPSDGEQTAVRSADAPDRVGWIDSRVARALLTVFGG
jgi:hypothetical protein